MAEASMSTAPTSGSETALSGARQASVDQKIADAEIKRQTGNEAFKAGDMRGALGHYYSVLLLLKGLDSSISSAFPTPTPPLPPSTDQEGKIEEVSDGDVDGDPSTRAHRTAPKSQGSDRMATVKKTIGLTYSNMAACHLKLQNWRKALQFSLDALKINEDDNKAKFREAMARIMLGELMAGRRILEELQTKHDDAAIRNALKQLDLDERARDAKSKAQFRGMFSRGKSEDVPVIGSTSALSSSNFNGASSSSIGALPGPSVGAAGLGLPSGSGAKPDPKGKGK